MSGGLRVRIEHGQDAGKTYRLPGPGAYRFGRTPQASIQILDMKVSKDHFEIVLPNGAQGGGSNGPATIRDLGSSHGTLLNAQKVTGDARVLSPGDEIRLGLTVLRVLSDGPGDAEVKPTGPAPASTVASTTMASSAGVSDPGAAGGAGNGGAAKSAAKPAAGAPAKGPDPKRALPPDALVGTTLAGYKIIEKVGAGGMGAVYRAEQLSLHREVALKVLAEKLVSDSAFVDQFVNEARAAGQLNHPNVVQVYDVGEADGRHFFSMEFIHGGPLEDRIPKGVKAGVPWQDALGWFLDAANALIFAEKKGILHRDIKPDNFMLSADGSVKLCDLGLAKKSESADLLAQGIIGTPHFISPEAIRRRTDVDRRSDLYSLGCTFYRLLTGKNPYPAASVKEILLAHLNAPVPRASAQVPDLPKELDEVIFKLMQKDPAARFQGAEDLWAALDKIRLQFGLAAHGLHPGRARRIAILAAAGGLIAVGVAVYFAFIRPNEVRETVREVIREGQPGISPEQLKESKAETALSRIEGDAKGLGDLETSYRMREWDSIVQRFEDLAANPDYEGTPSAVEASKRAKEIHNRRQELAQRATEFDFAKKKAEFDLETLRKEVVEKIATLRGAGKLFEADDAARDGLKKLDDDLAKREKNGKRLLDDESLDKARTLIGDERKTLASALQTDFDDVTKRAAAAVKPGTATALDDALSIWKKWVDEHGGAPSVDATAPLAVSLKGHVESANHEIVDLTSRKQEAGYADLRADQFVYLALVKNLFQERSDASAGGLLVRFRFGEATAAATTARDAAKTPGYRAAIERWIDRSKRLAAFADALQKGFQAAPTKETFVGTGGGGWKGVVKEVNAEGVVVEGKLRPFAEESLGFLFDLLYDAKQQKERIALDADAHEALALLAMVGVVSENGSFLARVEGEAKKAAAADAARSARLSALQKEAAEEAAARTLWDDAWKATSEVDAEITKILAKIETVDEKTSKAGRAEAIEKEADLRSRLQKARDGLKALKDQHVSSVVLAVHVDAPPQNASWAGEPPLPPLVKKGPTPPPAAPTPPPSAAMDDAGMKEETGAMNGDAGDAGMGDAGMGEPGMGGAEPAMGDSK